VTDVEARVLEAIEATILTPAAVDYVIKRSNRASTRYTTSKRTNRIAKTSRRRKSPRCKKQLYNVLARQALRKLPTRAD
jgi:hypothetical protein